MLDLSRPFMAYARSIALGRQAFHDPRSERCSGTAILHRSNDFYRMSNLPLRNQSLSPVIAAQCDKYGTPALSVNIVETGT
jgi:hypothetical protein